MIDALPTFIAVAEAASFSKVAMHDGVAVSSITRRITLLELELGAKLFTRSSRNLTLTDAGQHLLPRARTIMAEVSEAKEGLSALNDDPRGVLSVTAPSTFGRQHIVPAIVSFLKLYPQMEIDLHTSDAIVNLAERRTDVAIRIGEMPSSDLMTTQLAPYRRYVCASPSYIAASGKLETPLDLFAHNCLTIASQPNPSGWWSFEGINKNLPLPISGNLRCDDTATLLEAALAGVGVVHLASWMVGELVTSGHLVALFPHLQPPKKLSSSIHAVWMPGRSHTAKVQLFIAHLRKCFGSPPYWEQL